jgi:DNA-binding protein HU-beta
MKKKEFIDAVSKAAGLAKNDTEAAVNAVFNCLTDLLAKGDSIVFQGVASFSVKQRAARTIKSPATRKPVDIPATNVVRFKAGSKLKERINA